MAPGQAPHQSAPWRGSHPFFLLSPLMGLLSKAWSHLRGPGPPEPWLLDPVARADQGEAGPEGKAKTFLATHRAPEGRHFPAETGDGGAAEKDGEGFWGASHDLKASHDLEAWGLSDGDDEEDGGEQTTTCVPQEQGSEFVRGRPAPRSPSLLVRTLQGPPGEEKSEGGAAAEDEMVTFFSFPPSLWECCPGEEAEEGEAINKEAARTPTFPLSPGSKPKAWGYWAGEEGDQATEEKKTENNKATKSAVSPSSSGVHPRAWECGSGEESEEEEDEFNDSGAAEEEGEAGSPSSIPPTSAFIRAWVYRPGEDTEEDEDSDLGAAEEEGEAESSFSVPATGTFLRAWVYRPGEDTEEEDENEEEDDSETTDSAPSPSLQAQSALLGSGIYRSGEDTEGREVAKSRGEAEPRPLRVAIYLPGERPPPAWAPPRLPVRLQRRLKSTETPTRRPDPESPGKARKVHFSEKVSVHLLAVWAGPAQAARRGPWEQLARDRSRFARRIAQAQEQLGPCLTPAARARAWARFKDPTPPLATTPPPTQILPSSSIQSTPLSPVRASPFDPPSPSPGLDLSGRRG